MKAYNITAYIEDSSQIEAIKAIIKAFKIKYTISEVEETESPYNAEFVAMIKQGEKDLHKGKGIRMNLDDFGNLCK